MPYLLTHIERDNETPVQWAETRDDAERWVLEHPPEKYEYIHLYELKEDGGVEYVTGFEFNPEPYRGPLVRARVTVPRGPHLFHRAPIDCVRPSLPSYVMTEDRPLRIVENSCCGTDHLHQTEEFMTCHCGDWTVVEGSPEEVEKWVERARSLGDS